MSASSHFLRLPGDPDVLGELLHSLSQPLTSLRCSLELSLDDVREQQQESVSIALQQTEKVIGMIQLMREYLDADQSGPKGRPVAVASALRSVVEELSSIAAVRGVRLCLVGTCAAKIPAPELRLRLALQYLITAMIEAQAVSGGVMLLLGEGPAGAVLRAEGDRGFREPTFGKPNFRGMEQSATRPPATRDADISAAETGLRKVRLAIASRVLESAGASLVFNNNDVGPAGFVLRIPRQIGAPAW
jgi:hypothetical protein